MGRYKVCVYAISKDEEAFADRWMDSAGEADWVIVVDTGSTDRTVELLRARGAVVYEESIVPWRFDAARNVALDRVPEEADICVSVDLDEAFEPGWRQKLEDAWQPGHTRARFFYNWSHREDGTPDRQFQIDKIHSRRGYRWVHPVHEVLQYGDTDGEKMVYVEGLVLDHHPDSTKSRGQYLQLLELSVQENPLDSQATFWLGREYSFYGMHEACIGTLKQYLSLPSALWAEERSAAMRLIAQCCEAKGDGLEARSWLFRAVAESQDLREPYLAMAAFAYREENWPLMYAMVKKGLSVTLRSGSYLAEPVCWGVAFYDYGAVAAFRMGLLEEARSSAAEACAREPGNARLRSNLSLIDRQLQDEAKKAGP